jgi:hypothetical protein
VHLHCLKSSDACPQLTPWRFADGPGARSSLSGDAGARKVVVVAGSGPWFAGPAPGRILCHPVFLFSGRGWSFSYSWRGMLLST